MSQRTDEAVLGKAYDIVLLRRLWPFVAQHPRLLLASILLMPCSIAFELAQPYIVKLALVNHIAINQTAGLGLLALIYTALVLGQSISSYFEQSNVQLLGQRSMHSLRLAIYDHVLAQRAGFFDRMPVGRLMTRMTNDIENINEMFAQGVVTLIADFVKMTVIVVIMLVLDWQLTLLTFTTLPLLWGLVRYARGAMRRSFREIRLRLAAMNSFVQEHLSGIRVVQFLGRTEAAGRQYNTINAAHRDAYLESIRADAAMYAMVEAIGVLAIGLVAWFAARRLGADATSAIVAVGTVAVFIEYINKFFIPVRDLSAKYAVMQGAMAAAERITSLLDTHEPDGTARPLGLTDATPGAAAAKADSGAAITHIPPPANADTAVAFQHVSFGYGDDLVLRNVTLAVPRGATVAVVGATGSGKSTLVKLLARLYETQAGHIELFGTDIATLPLDVVRKRITVVSQDVMLFAGTLYENIALGSTIERSKVEAAVASVGLNHILGTRGLDLDTPVRERGANFSTGERQLIAFCRALVRNPEVLVLDEATAHVDPQAERLIEAGVAALMKDRTTLVIAHRLSTIRNAAMIVVMDRGRVIETGSHDELVALGGMYAALERTFRRK
ncbi:MAG: ABC transporter ATP-binding protein [Kofleriaceae bacterium]|nr:ABC transporter ATP-binding protein [Kofleriaceae bacterium]